MKPADIDRCVDYVNDLFFALKYGFAPPPSVEVHECPDGCIWLMFFRKDGRTAVVELHLRNRLRASIAVASIVELSDQLLWAEGCLRLAGEDRKEYLSGREAISKDYLRTLLKGIDDGRKNVDEVEGALLGADVVLPRQDVESAVVFVIAAEEVAT